MKIKLMTALLLAAGIAHANSTHTVNMPAPVTVVVPSGATNANTNSATSSSNPVVISNPSASATATSAPASASQSQTQSVPVTVSPSFSPTASPTVTSSPAAKSDASNANNAAQTVSVSSPRQTSSAAMVAVHPTAVCSGVTAGSAQGVSFGVSFGTSWTDENCQLLEQVRSVANLGDIDEAKEMLCVIPNYREVREAMGRPCVTRVLQTSQNSSGTSSLTTSAPQYTDPIIRHRLGLPPL